MIARCSCSISACAGSAGGAFTAEKLKIELINVFHVSESSDFSAVKDGESYIEPNGLYTVVSPNDLIRNVVGIVVCKNGESCAN